MLPGKFICNIYNPKLKKAIDVYGEKLTDGNKKKETFNIMLNYIKDCDIGDPKETKNNSVEDLKKKGFIGLYTNPKTPVSTYNLLSLMSNKDPKTEYIPENSDFSDINAIVEDDEPIKKDDIISTEEL